MSFLHFSTVQPTVSFLCVEWWPCFLMIFNAIYTTCCNPCFSALCLICSWIPAQKLAVFIAMACKCLCLMEKAPFHPVSFEGCFEYTFALHCSKCIFKLFCQFHTKCTLGTFIAITLGVEIKLWRNKKYMSHCLVPAPWWAPGPIRKKKRAWWSGKVSGGVYLSFLKLWRLFIFCHKILSLLVIMLNTKDLHENSLAKFWLQEFFPTFQWI